MKATMCEFAYYGDVSFVFLANEKERTIVAHLQNSTRASGESVAAGDEMWCSWVLEDAVLLTA